MTSWIRLTHHFLEFFFFEFWGPDDLRGAGRRPRLHFGGPLIEPIFVERARGGGSARGIDPPSPLPKCQPAQSPFLSMAAPALAMRPARPLCR